MTIAVAINIFVSIMLVGVTVWLVSLYFALRIGRATESPDWFQQDKSGFGRNVGEAVCDASRDELLERIPKVLRRQSLGILNSLFKADELSASELSVTRYGPMMCNLPSALYFSKVHFRFEPVSPKQTRVCFVIDQTDVMKRLKQIAMAILFGIGLPTIIGVGSLVWFQVIPAQNLAVRWQVLQTGQICHVIWPPFLFIGIAAMASRATKQFIERVLMVASDSELSTEVVGPLPRLH
jgi:hypothetical protein